MNTPADHRLLQEALEVLKESRTDVEDALQNLLQNGDNGQLCCRAIDTYRKQLKKHDASISNITAILESEHHKRVSPELETEIMASLGLPATHPESFSLTRQCRVPHECSYAQHCLYGCNKAPEAQPTARYSDIVSDGGMDPRNQPAAQPEGDIPDLIAGALHVSRGHAYELMFEALRNSSEYGSLVAAQPVAIPADKAVQALKHIRDETWLDIPGYDNLNASEYAAMVLAEIDTAPAADQFPEGLECPASGQGHSFGPHGYNGEIQCKYCAESPAVTPDASADVEPMYYLQDTRGYAGNCPLWWGLNGNGYTTDLRKAQKYTLSEAMRQHRSRGTDLPWLCSEIDPLARPTIDIQDVHKLRSNAAQAAAIAKDQP